MPEIAEVEKLRRQIEPAWMGTAFVGFSALRNSSVDHYFENSSYPGMGALFTKPIIRVNRLAKHLWIETAGPSLHVHLSSTGWIMPGNVRAKQRSKIDPIHANFLHKVSENNIRMILKFEDGQEWFYHDPRTWGRFAIHQEKSPREIPALRAYGPDWLEEPINAIEALRNHQSGRKFKDVLCDQHVACGLGNYLACEVAWLVGVHPHIIWDQLKTVEKAATTGAVQRCLSDALMFDNHAHWKVFKRLGEKCERCGGSIKYRKDKGGSRGSYYCGKCQRLD